MGEMKAYPKYFEKIRIRPEKDAELKSRAPTCQWDGCNEAGTHRAPVGRLKEGEYFRFCFDHVREYNKGFNYFSGVSDNEIARFQKEALTGHRPTWRMGANSGGTRSAPERASRASARQSRLRPRRWKRLALIQRRLVRTSRRVIRNSLSATIRMRMAATEVRKIGSAMCCRPIGCSSKQDCAERPYGPKSFFQLS